MCWCGANGPFVPSSEVIRPFASPGLLFEALRARQGAGGSAGILNQVFPAHRATPLVTVLDGHPHTLAFLAGINQVRAAHLGVTNFGQSGSLEDVYHYHGLDTDTIVRTALDIRI